MSRRFDIDVDAGDDAIERWFLAATLFGTRINATIVEQTFRELDKAGVVRVEQARHLRWENLVALPGWGPITVGNFLRELRGVWPGADPPLDERATLAATHLDLLTGSGPPVRQLDRLARVAGLDPRDLESGLVWLTLAHAARVADCPGGLRCTALGRRHRPATA